MLNKEVLSHLFSDKAPLKKTVKPATKSMFKIDLMNFMKKFTSKKSPEKVVAEPKRKKKTKKKTVTTNQNEP